MNQVCIICAGFLMLQAGLYAQGIKSVLDNEVNPGEVLIEFDSRTTGLKGDFYIDDTWQKGDIYLKSEQNIRNQWIRYDLQNDLLEIKFRDEIKVIPLNRLDHFNLLEPGLSKRYMNCDRFSFEDGTRLSGICQVLVNGFFGAMVKYDYEIKKADYVPALDMGSRHDEVLIKKYPFLLKEGYVYRMPRRKKEFYDFVINPYADVRAYMKENNLNFRREPDLVRIIEYLNQSVQ